MCSPFSAILKLNPPSPEEFQQLLKEGYEHLAFCVDVYKWQLSRGAYFLHEHPVNASSWKLPIMQELECLAGVDLVVGDQSLKRTGWLTDMPTLKKALAVKCYAHLLPADIGPQHIPLI
eukprot:981125-Karenia_brevis.AAC.1